MMMIIKHKLSFEFFDVEPSLNNHRPLQEAGSTLPHVAQHQNFHLGLGWRETWRPCNRGYIEIMMSC